MAGFQTVINTVPAPGVAGDFCTVNPRYAAIAGPGALVAGPSGLTVGQFAWISSPTDPDGTPAIANNYGGGPVAGFVARLQEATFPAIGGNILTSEAGMTIMPGRNVTLMSAGDFWIKNDGATIALPGMKAYALATTGKASFAAPGAPTTTTQTTATIAAGTAATFSGSIAGSILTITGTVTNTLYLGALLAGTGVATGTQIVSQLTGVAGAAGTYAVNVPGQTVAATAMTATPYLAAGTGGAGIALGSTISATSTGATGTIVGGIVTAIITAGTNVVVMLPYPGTGTNTTATLTFSQNVETSWYCRSSGVAGELVKIANLPGLG